MGEADETDNSEDSDTTEGETEDTEEGDNKTPVIEEGDSSEVTVPVEEETPEETEIDIPDESANPETSEEPEVDNRQDVQGSGIMSVTPSSAVISFDSKSGGEAETAGISWLGGCVDSSNQLAQGKDLRFRIKLNDGRKLTKVEAKIGETGEGKTPTTKTLTNPSADADTIYEVKWADIKTAVDNKEIGQPVQIVVTTEAQTYGITFVGTQAKIYPVVAIPAAEGATSKGNMPGTTVAGTVTSAAYDTAVTYVVKANEGYKLKDAKVGETPVTIGTTKLYATAEAETTADFDTISIKPSDYKKAWDEGTFTVTVNAVAVAKLKAEIADNANVTLSDGTSTDDDVINYDADGVSDKFAPVAEGELKDTSKLSFGVKAEDNYEITSVTAVAKTKSQIDADEDGTAIPETAIVKGDAAAGGVVPYTISLASLQAFTEDTTVFITVNTTHTAEYEGVNVHTITFAGDFKNADVTTGADTAEDLPEDHIVKVDGEDSLQINVTPHPGYALPKRGGNDEDTKDDSVITVSKQVRYEKTAGSGEYDDAVTQTEDLAVTGDFATLTLAGTDAEQENKKFTVVSATVTINTEVEVNDDDKQLRVTNDLAEDAEYSVQYAEKDSAFTEADLDETLSTDGGLTEDELDNIWYIPEAAALVKVTVTTGKKPVVALDDTPLTEEEGDGYVYIFPAANLKTAGNGGSSLTIEEDKTPAVEEPANVMVKINTNDVAYSNYKVGGVTQTAFLEDEDADGYAALTEQAVIGKSLSLTFKAVDGATLKSVSYTMGEEAAQTVEVKKGAATLEIEEVTDDLKIDVVSESAYVVKLYDDVYNELKKDKDGVYEADYNDTGITIHLYKTENQNDDVSFYDVVVEDGSATAETGATIDPDDDTYATLDQVHESERGKTLTIKVYKKGEERPFEAKLRTNAESSSVKVTRVVKGKTTEVKKDESVEVANDAKITFTVDSVGASVSDLGVKLFKKDGTVLTDAEKAWFSDITADGRVTVGEDGTFTITTTPAASTVERGEVEVRIYNTNKEAAVGQEKALEGAGSFKLNVKGYMIKNDVKDVTAAPGVASNTTVRINLNTTFVDKKNLPSDPVRGDLYYKVVLGEIKVDSAKPLPEKVAVLTESERTRYYKLPVDNYANPAKTVAIDLVKDTREGDAAKEDIQSALSTTIEEVSLVQSLDTVDLETKQGVTAADYVSGPAATIKDKDKTLTNKAPIYETKLTVKTLNGAAVITGQQDVKVATPVFGAATGYDELTVQFVDTKTGVAYSNPGTTTTLSSNAHAIGDGQKEVFTAKVNPVDNSILVSAAADAIASRSLYKTLGVKVTAQYPTTEIGSGYAASAVVKLNVKQGIFDIDEDESKEKMPETIYMDGTKNATLKIAARLNYGYKDYKPAKSNLTWSIDYEGQSDNIKKNMNAVDAKGKAAPTVSVKNGTLTVTKGYQFSADGSEDDVVVTATAADFTGNEISCDFIFTITDEADAITAEKLVIVDAQGNVKDAKALPAEEFDQTLYVAALKNDVKPGQTKYETSDFMPVTVKAGSKANLDVGSYYSSNRAPLIFKKPGTKLKLNVNTRDGGKVNAKAALEVNILPYENIGLYFEGADSSEYDPETDVIEYTGGGNQMYQLTLQHKHTVGYYADSWQNDSAYKNVKVTVKGGKLISNKNWAANKEGSTSYIGDAVVVTSADGKATVTLVDNANNKKKIEYQITNTAADSGKAKAPSIKLYAPKKITNESLWNEDEARFDPIVYQVTDKNTENYAGEYVMITPDHTVAGNCAEYLADNWDHITVAKIDENGRFEVWFEENLNDNDWYYDLPGGTYKMIATVGSMEHGVFQPKAKDVKLNFSIPKEKKLTTSMNVTAKYTLDAKSSSKADIVVKTDSRLSYVVSEAKNVIKDAKTQGQTKDTHTNEFTRYFEVKPKTNVSGDRLLGYTIGLKNTLSAEEIEYITGATEDKDVQKKAKEDCVGYITVTNASRVTQNGDEWVAAGTRYNTKDIKVTIAFKETKYSVTGASVFAPKDNQPATVNVTLMNGKKPVNVVAAALDGEDTKSFAASATAENDGTIKITSNAAVEAKKHDVMLKVIPEDSGYIKSRTWDGQKYVTTYVNKDATTTYPEAEAIEKFGVKVTAKIDVKAADAKKVLKIDSKKLNIVLNADDYVPGEAGHMGAYEVYVPYGFVAGNTDISTAAGSVKLDVDKDNKTLNEIAGKEDNKDLINVEAYEGPQNNRVTNDDYEDCIRIRVNKAVLDKQYEKTEANKKAAAKDKVPVVTTYGAKLSVPVVFTYTNNGTTTETVKFNITMPKKPLTFDEIKDILTGTTKVGTGKNARDIKAEIENIRTPQSNKSYEILNGLLSKVWHKVDGVIPKDSDVVLTPDWSGLDWTYDTVTKADLNDGGEVDNAAADADYDGIMNKGTAKVNMTITNTLAAGDAAKASLTYSFNDKMIGVKHEKGVSGTTVADTVAATIQEYLNSLTNENDSEYLTLTNDDLKEDAFLNTIKGLDGVKEYMTARDSINIWMSFAPEAATERKDGYLEVTVYVNDEYTTATLEGKIKRIKNLGDASAALGTAFDVASIQAIVDDCSGIKEKISAKILADATKAVGNDKLTVAYAQRDKADTDSVEKEPVFDYTSADDSNPGSVKFTLEITSQSGRKETYASEEFTLAALSGKKYFATATEAVAAITKATVTSGDEDTEEYDVLATKLASVENTQASVEGTVKAMLNDTALASVATGWTAKNITVSYTPADPDTEDAQDNTVEHHPGKVTFSADIVLKGDESVKGSLSVQNAEVVPWKNTFQTADQLKNAIDANKVIEVAVAANLPADADTASTGAQDMLEAVVNPLVTGTGLTVEYGYGEGESAAKYEKNADTNVVTYGPVTITIKKGGEEAATWTGSFTWSVKAAG